VKGALVLALVLLAGCRQLLGFDDPTAVDAIDARSDGPADARASVYALEVLADRPLAYWRFGADSTAKAIDVTKQGHDGLYSPAPTFEAGPLAGEPDDRAVVFDGLSVVSMGSKFGFEGTAPFTIEAWVRAGTLANNGGIVSKNIEMGGLSRQGWVLMYLPTNEGLLFERSTGDANKQSVTITAVLPAAGPWRHVVVTFDGIELVMTVDSDASATSLQQVSMPATNGSFAIGARNGGADERFRGAVDEVAVYDHALSRERIARHYAAGVGP
jgi:hypothetical protein